MFFWNVLFPSTVEDRGISGPQTLSLGHGETVSEIQTVGKVIEELVCIKILAFGLSLSRSALLGCCCCCTNETGYAKNLSEVELQHQS